LRDFAVSLGSGFPTFFWFDFPLSSGFPTFFWFDFPLGSGFPTFFCLDLNFCSVFFILSGFDTFFDLDGGISVSGIEKQQIAMFQVISHCKSDAAKSVGNSF